MEPEQLEELLQRLNRQMLAIMEHQMVIFTRLLRLEAQVGRLAPAQEVKRLLDD